MALIDKKTMYIKKHSSNNQMKYQPQQRLSIENLMTDFGVVTEWNKDAQIHEWKLDLTRRIFNDAPKYQRIDTSTLRWQQSLISSILNDIPFPSFYLRDITSKINNKYSGFNYEIVDGGHRMRTIMWFILDKFDMPKNYGKVEVNGFLHDISGQSFSQLKEVVQRKFIRSNFTVETFSSNNHAAARMFQLINDGNPMSPQEYRASIETDLADLIRGLASTAATSAKQDVPDQHKLFQYSDGEPLIGFKYKDLDWDASLAQMALFSSEDNLDNMDGKALDKFYLDLQYHTLTVDFLELSQRLTENLDDLFEILLHIPYFKPKKNYLVNLYMFVDTLKTSGYQITNVDVLAKKYLSDEQKRSTSVPLVTQDTGVKIGNHSTYAELTSRAGGKKVQDRLTYIMSAFENEVDKTKYGVERV
jgi:hypothetical protein